jgi:hypothetical protein
MASGRAANTGLRIAVGGALRLDGDVPELVPLFNRDESLHGLFADTVGPGHEIGMTVGRTMFTPWPAG